MKSREEEQLNFGYVFLDGIIDHLVKEFNPEEIFGEDKLLKFVKGGYDPEEVCLYSQLQDWARCNNYVIRQDA